MYLLMQTYKRWLSLGFIIIFLGVQNVLPNYGYNEKLSPSSSFSKFRENVEDVLSSIASQGGEKSYPAQKLATLWNDYKNTSFLKVPAGKLLSTLELINTENIPFKQGHGNTLVKQISALPLDPNILPSKGIEILQSHFQTDSFELIYNFQGELIAIFPTDDNIYDYFDLSPFYIEVPRMDDPKAGQKWKNFAPELKKNKEIIRKYYTSRYNDIAQASFRIEDLHGRPSYVRLQIDKENGHYFAQGFNPLEASFSKADPSKHEIIIPVFPAVYSPLDDDNMETDKGYMENFYQNVTAHDDLLIVGPGSGVDVWIASLKVKKKIYSVGISPLEIANLEAVADIAGFEVETSVSDNIISAEGKLAFEGIKFSKIAWNMPMLNLLGARSDDVTVGRWDQDIEGEDLHRFVQGLVRLLSWDGMVIIWNMLWSDNYEAGMSDDTVDEIYNILSFGEDPVGIKLLDVSRKNSVYVGKWPAWSRDYSQVGFSMLDYLEEEEEEEKKDSFSRLLRRRIEDIKKKNYDIKSKQELWDYEIAITIDNTEYKWQYLNNTEQLLINDEVVAYAVNHRQFYFLKSNIYFTQDITAKDYSDLNRLLAMRDNVLNQIFNPAFLVISSENITNWEHFIFYLNNGYFPSNKKLTDKLIQAKRENRILNSQNLEDMFGHFETFIDVCGDLVLCMENKKNLQANFAATSEKPIDETALIEGRIKNVNSVEDLVNFLHVNQVTIDDFQGIIITKLKQLAQKTFPFSLSSSLSDSNHSQSYLNRAA